MELQQPKILVFPFGLLSHYLRCISLLMHYREGYVVMFKNSAKYDHLLKAEGFEVFKCMDFDPEYVLDCTRKFRFSWLNERDLESVLAEQVRCIKEYKPEFVIGDMSPTLKMAGQLTNTPFISVINGYMSKYYLLQRPITSTHPAAFLKRLVPGEIFGRILLKQERKAFERIHEPFRAIRKRFGLEETSNYLDELEGDGTWICDDTRVFPQGKMPKSYEVIGPLLYSPASTGAVLPVMNSQKKKILVSFGSSGEWGKVKSLMDELFAEFIILTAGDDNGVLKAAHITPLGFVDLNEVLPHIDLIICHGGNGTLNYAYRHSVPFIAIPSIMEQEWNALRFSEVAAGHVITRKTSAQELYRIVVSMF